MKKINVAFIVHVFPKLSETFILNQITGLIDLGCNIDIFALESSNEDKIHEDVINYNLLNKVYYFYIPNNGIQRLKRFIYYSSIIFLRSPIKFWRFFHNVNTYTIYNLINKLLYSFPFLLKRYDIVHCHFGTLGKIFCFLKDIFKNDIKLITSFHGFDISTIVKRYGVTYYSDLFNKADLFLPISNYWKFKLINLGCPSEKIMVHRMGININKFSFFPRKKDANTIKVLSVCRLVEKKGIEYAIKAINLVKHRFSDINYLIVGDGPLKNNLQRLVMNLNLSDKVIFLGPKTSDEVQRLMQESHIFLLPSVTSQSGDMEGIPVVLMEALATGLPVISTRHSGIPELIIDGESGFLVPEKNVEAIAEKLEYLIMHPEIWPEMGRKGRELVEQNFDIKKLNQNLINIYYSLLKR